MPTGIPSRRYALLAKRSRSTCAERTRRTSPAPTPTAPRIALRLAISPQPANRRARDCAWRGRYETNKSSRWALQHLALLSALGGDARRGAQLLGYVDAQYSALGMQREPTEQWGYDKLLAGLQRGVQRKRDRAARGRRRGVVRRSGHRRSAEGLATEAAASANAFVRHA